MDNRQQLLSQYVYPGLGEDAASAESAPQSSSAAPETGEADEEKEEDFFASAVGTDPLAEANTSGEACAASGESATRAP